MRFRVLHTALIHRDADLTFPRFFTQHSGCEYDQVFDAVDFAQQP